VKGRRQKAAVRGRARKNRGISSLSFGIAIHLSLLSANSDF
jgi:hypothetical protein